MERIRLTKDEKKLLRSLNEGKECEGMSPCSLMVGAAGLEAEGLAQVAWTEGYGIDSIRLTLKGRWYIEQNPKLRNPIFDVWNWDYKTWLLVVSCTSFITSVSVLIKVLLKKYG